MENNTNPPTNHENMEKNPSITQIIPSKSFWYMTGVIPVITISFDEPRYRQLLNPFPIQANDTFTFSSNLVPHNNLVPSSNLKVRMWIAAQFYGIDDYVERDLGKKIVKTADDYLLAYNMTNPNNPTNLLVMYSSTGKIQHIPAPKYKPFPLLLAGSAYIAYFCIPFGICGTKNYVNRFCDRLIDRYPKKLLTKASNYLSNLLDNRILSLPPVLDEDLPDFIGDLHEDLIETFDTNIRGYN